MEQGQLSILNLILHASVVVQLVLLLLGLASVMSWSIILGKRSVLAKAQREATERPDRLVFVEIQLDAHDTPPLLRRLAERATTTTSPAER